MTIDDVTKLGSFLYGPRAVSTVRTSVGTGSVMLTVDDGHSLLLLVADSIEEMKAKLVALSRKRLADLGSLLVEELLS